MNFWIIKLKKKPFSEYIKKNKFLEFFFSIMNLLKN